jgi:hypothetical protein
MDRLYADFLRWAIGETAAQKGRITRLCPAG